MIPNKMGGSNPTLIRVNSVLARPVKPENKLKKIELDANSRLTNELFKYGNVTVPENGYYIVSNQLALQIVSKSNVTVNYIQYGVCTDDLSDFTDAFSSVVVNSSVQPEHVLSNNLCTTMYLQKDQKYCAWANVSSANNQNIEYVKEYSHLMLLKVSD